MKTNSNNKNIILPYFGLGCWQIAGMGWKGAGKDQGAETLITAFNEGVTFFDTAPIYGFGLSEEIIGEQLSGFRDKITIATKCGLSWKEGRVKHDLSYYSVLKECEESLERLNTDYIDLYQLHWPDYETPLEDTVRALEKLLHEKTIKHIGVCNFPMDELGPIFNMIDVETVQYEYNYLCHDLADSVMDFVKEKDLHFIAYSPLAQGLLTEIVDSQYSLSKRDVRRMNPLFKNRELFLKSLCRKEELGEDVIKKALKFIHDKKQIKSVLVGTCNRNHLLETMKIIENLQWYDLPPAIGPGEKD